MSTCPTSNTPQRLTVRLVLTAPGCQIGQITGADLSLCALPAVPEVPPWRMSR